MLRSKRLTERLGQAISKMPIIDCHTHLRWQQPSAENLADIFTYHYISTELVSAGMDRALLEDPYAPEEKIKNALPFLWRIENSTTYWCFMKICRELFDFEDTELNERNWEALYRRADKRLREEGWYRKVLKDRLNVRRAFLTNEFDDPLEGYDGEAFIPALRLDPLINQIAQRETIERVGKFCEREIGGLKDFKAAVGTIFSKFKDQGAISAAVSLPPDFQVFPVAEMEAETIFQNVLQGVRLSDDEFLRLRAHLFYFYVEQCQASSFVFQLMVGVIRGIYGDRDGFATDPNMLRTFWDLLNRYPETQFDFCILSRVLAQELTTQAKIFPNCVLSGHWWYNFYPGYIKEALRERLEMVPGVKLNGFFSDSYYCEWSVAKVALYTKVLTEVLSEKVEDGYLTEDQAVFLAQRLLYENPIENFRLTL